MKFFMLILAGLCMILLAFFLAGRNCAVMFHNIFYAAKKRYGWDAEQSWKDLDILDITEGFYHK